MKNSQRALLAAALRKTGDYRLAVAYLEGSASPNEQAIYEMLMAACGIFAGRSLAVATPKHLAFALAVSEWLETNPADLEDMLNHWVRQLPNSGFESFEEFRVMQGGPPRSVVRTSEKSRDESQHLIASIVLLVAIIGVGALAGVFSGDSGNDDKLSTRNLPAAPTSMSKNDPVNLLELPLPANGIVAPASTKLHIAPMKVNAPADQHVFLILNDCATGELAVSAFLRAGSSAEFEVPAGCFRLQYASGERWYGYRHLFANRQCFEAEDRFFFYAYGDTIRGNEVTLYKVSNGNLETTPIAEDDFLRRLSSLSN